MENSFWKECLNLSNKIDYQSVKGRKRNCKRNEYESLAKKTGSQENVDDQSVENPKGNHERKSTYTTKEEKNLKIQKGI